MKLKQDELLLYADYLLRLAMSKCNTQSDAEDLLQDTLLAALNYLKKGGEIEYPKTWLANTMMNRFYTSLRKKYRQPSVVSYENLSVDLMDDEQELLDLEQTDEAIELRREITYLSRIYRSVIVRYYVHGQSISEIAQQLGIPEGTVKSRLDSGRKQIKKGMEKMNYPKEENELYTPKNLNVTWTGSLGKDNRPSSVVHNDKIAQNLLILAYEKPIAVPELAKKIGIPTVYLEPIIEKLIDEEFMARTDSRKVYTDFVINNDDERYSRLAPQIEFVRTHFDIFKKYIDRILDKARNLEYAKTLNPRQLKKLERYMIMTMLEKFTIGTGNKIYGQSELPYRKYGGRWHIISNIYLDEYIPTELSEEYGCYTYAGQRTTGCSDWMGSKDIRVREYDTTLYDNPHRYHFFGGTSSFEQLAKFLYAVCKGIDIETTDIKSCVIENIPAIITNTGLVTKENDKLIIDIPVMDPQTFREIDAINIELANECGVELEAHYREFLETVKLQIPAHLTSVPEFIRYRLGWCCIVMAVVREAFERGIHVHDVDYCCPPLILVIDE